MRKTLKLTVILLLSSLWALAQNQEITGKIADSTGAPVSGASVRIKGVKGGTSAGPDGSFRIAAPTGSTLIISAVGFQTIEVPASRADMITLHNSTNTMSEVVVTSLGIRREKRNLTYSTQEIKGESLVEAKQDNILNGLSGKVSGVQITNTTGMPGSSARIVIRGATSLTQENQPLFVVDGVPIDNTEAGSIDATGVGADNAALNQGSSSNRGIDLDPNIIESVTILKGAAATALYGAAAARGALIITTKTGARNSKPQVTVSSSYTMGNPLYYDVQNQWAQGQDFQFIDGNQPGTKSSYNWGPRVDTLHDASGKLVKTYDQQKMFFKTAHTTDNNITVSGASDKSRYLMSYSYLKNDGITPHTDFTRHSVFGKFSNQLGSKFNATFQLNYINTINNRINEGNGLANPLWTVFAAPITWNPLPDTLADGSQNLYRSPSRNNPYYVLDHTGFVSKVNRFLPTMTFTYNALPWLTFTERIGADIFSDQSTYHESVNIINGTFVNNGGVSNRNENYTQFNSDFIIQAHKDLGEDLIADFLVGTNVLARSDRFTAQTGIGQTVGDFYNIGTFSSITASDDLSRYRKVGVYAQANLEYKRMFTLALTGRYDGTSALAKNKAWYPYGSVAAGFIFSELLHGNPAGLSFGKVRLSYSAVGNDNLNPYALSTKFLSATGTANNIVYPYNGQTAYLINNVLGNPTLKNESLTEFEAGLELKFLHNRLSFEGSYFARKTTDLLTPVPIGPSSGYYKSQLNAGSMQNKGIELLVSGLPIKTRDFSWDITATFTRIRNKVLELAPGVSNIQFGGFGGGGGVYAFAGQPYGMLYGSTYQRDPKGNVIIDDDPNSGTYGTPLTGVNLGIIGNTNPDFLAGLSNSFTYKQFSFSFLLDWKQGGDIFNLDDHYNWFYGTPKATTSNNRANTTLKGVLASDNSKPNNISISAQQFWTNISNIDEACIEDGTFVKVRNASLAYNVSPEMLKRGPFRSITISFTGTNLFIYRPHYSSPDPEASISGNGNGQGVTNYMTPTTRNFILGLRLGL